MDEHGTSTMLPPVRRTKRRHWGRLVALILCGVFAVIGAVPMGLGLVLRTRWARDIATYETKKLIAVYGVRTRYQLELNLWPLSVGLRNLRVEATDGGTPFLTARRASARPKIFGLLAGKLVIDQIEIEQPRARIVLKDGALQNLSLNLPEQPKREGPFKAPFSVVSASDGEVELDIDGVRAVAREIDTDITADDDGAGGSAFEIALRVATVHGRMVRTLKDATSSNQPTEYAVDEDLLCRVDARARIEAKRIFVRRFSTFGAVDQDPAEETSLGCDVSKEHPHYVELALGHFSVGLPFVAPKSLEDIPKFAGHLRVRLPLGVLNRIPNFPTMDGWVLLDSEFSHFPVAHVEALPEMSGVLEAKGVRIDRYNFAQAVNMDFTLRQNVFRTPLLRVEIADGVANVTDVEVEPLAPGIPIKTYTLVATNASFASLMTQLGFAKHPHVTWDLDEIRTLGFQGTIFPLHLDGDIVGHTKNLAVFDRAIDDPTRTRAMGTKEGHFSGKVSVRPDALQFKQLNVRTTHSTMEQVLVSIGFHEVLHVELPRGKIDISDVSPLGNVPMTGVADVSVTVDGPFANPHLEADISSIQNFVISDLPFGNVTQGHVTLSDQRYLDLRDIRAVKGNSNFELTTGRLDFGSEASMQMDAQVSSKDLDIRDFFNIFKLDQDPRFTEIQGILQPKARMHLALGGPEDICKGGYLDVQASLDAKKLNLMGEKFDEGHADFEYRWFDQKAGIEGAEIDVRSLSLTKVKKEGRAPVGSVLGSLSVRRGGDLRGNMVIQGFPLARTDLLGSAASLLEGSVSGVGRLGGTISAFHVDVDANVTPVRILGAPFGPSDVHLAIEQLPSKSKIIGKTACGAPIGAPFDKEAWLRDTSVQGTYTATGTLFGGQVRLDNVVVTNQKAPVTSGRIELSHFDLGPIGKLLATTDEEVDSSAPKPDATTLPLGGELTGEILIERIAANDFAHAKVQFTPRAMHLTRGGQSLALRTSPSTAPVVALGPPITIRLAEDDLMIPPLTFDIAARGGFKGAFTLKGAVKKITKGAELALVADLLPIDLGLFVGVVPRVTRAMGTLTGSIKLQGKASQPEFDGQLHVRQGEFALKGVPGTITDVEIDVTADENEARITRGAGHFLGGEVGLTARMPLKGGQIGVAGLNLTGRQLFVSPLEGVKATVDADLQVSVNAMATSAQARLPVVSGEVTITDFEYTRPITADVSGIRGSKRTIVENYDPSLDAVVFGFDIRSRVPLRIRNNLVDARLAIDPRGLRVTGTNQRIGLRGELTTLIPGHIRVFANEFELQRGTIRFDDATRIAPHVDITAMTEYRRYTNTLTTNTSAGGGISGISGSGRGSGLWRITLHAYGDTEDLHIDMTSDPSLARDDIFLLLTVGLTRAELDQVRASSGSGSVYAGALFETVGTMSGVDRAVKQAIPVIDDFRPGTAYSPRTGRVEPNITVGQRLGPNVRASVTTGLAEDPQLRSTIEWRLGRTLTVEPSYDRINTVSSSTVGNFGLDFRWRLEFD